MVLYGLVFIVIFVETQRYKVTHIDRTDTGITGTLHLSKDELFPPDKIKDLSFQFTYETSTRVHLQIKDAKHDRWEVPDVVVSSKKSPKRGSELEYNVSVEEDIFSFKITRTTDNFVIFDTSGFEFCYADQYLELSTRLATTSPNIYGLGERKHSLRLNPDDKTYPIFNRDRGTPLDKNLYGTHPFYMELLDNGKAHGVFYLSSNAQDFNINANNSQLKWRTIGGIIDIYFFVGDSPKEVVKQYLEVIGTPFLPPLWSLGTHQCRWGYKSVSESREMVNHYRKYDIPLEVAWNDIDYMDGFKIFTTDPALYPQTEFREYIDWLHENNQKYVNIIDPSVAILSWYHPYDLGVDMDIFIKEPNKKKYLKQKQWPGYTYWPDWSHTNISEYWGTLIAEYLKKLPLDGFWLDMNEVAGFCDGECLPVDEEENSSENNNNNNGRRFHPMFPPYTPGGENLNLKTSRMDAEWEKGIEYNLHNLFGFLESKLTVQIQQQLTQKRAFIISRASFAGSGRFNGHWLGDNHATWDDLYYSIPGSLTMSLFGMAMTGSDICGFGGDTTEELCSRWYEVGAFYPFMRNHNTHSAISQEPYAFGPALVNSSRKSINMRYSLLPYFYTQFFLAHTEGETVFRPLFFEFPSDSSGLLPSIDRQFLIGPAVMVSPVLTRNEFFVEAYVPNSRWYDLWTLELLDCAKQQKCRLPAPLDHVNVHVREGFSVPRKDPKYTVTETFSTAYNLVIALDEAQESHGVLVMDDGESLETVKQEKYSLITFDTSLEDKSGAPRGNNMNVVIKNTIVKSGYEGQNAKLGEIFVLGKPEQVVKEVVVDGQPWKEFEYDPKKHVLRIYNLLLSVLEPFTIVVQ